MVGFLDQITGWSLANLAGAGDVGCDQVEAVAAFIDEALDQETEGAIVAAVGPSLNGITEEGTAWLIEFSVTHSWELYTHSLDFSRR